MDKIILKDIKAMGHYGAFPGEKDIPQAFSADVTLFTDISAAAASDDLRDAVDYALVYVKVRQFIEENSFDLLETLVCRLCDMLLADERVEKVKVRVEKTAAAFGDITFSAAVEAERERKR